MEAFDDVGSVVGTVILGPNNELDGSATPWSFNLGSPVIKKIKVRYSGAQTTGVGLAFDNFTPSSPGLNPVPSIDSRGIVILSVLVAGLAIGVMRRRETQRAAQG